MKVIILNSRLSYLTKIKEPHKAGKQSTHVASLSSKVWLLFPVLFRKAQVCWLYQRSHWLVIQEFCVDWRFCDPYCHLLGISPWPAVSLASGFQTKDHRLWSPPTLFQGAKVRMMVTIKESYSGK